MPKWSHHPQGSDAWLLSRIGKLTASRMADAMAVTKNGDSEKRRKLKLEIAAERLTGRATEVYVNSAMQHGIRFEPEARNAYENATGNIVELCGLADHDTIEHLACSPDGLVGDDGCIEIKCPSLTTFIQYKLDGVVPEQYRPQMLLQMAVTNRKWCDFIAYHPYLPESMNLFIVRFEPSAEELHGVLEAAEKFNAEVEEIISKLSGKGEF